MCHGLLLLLHLIRELESLLGIHVTHGGLQGVECAASAQLLGMGDHSHIDILLMGSLELLLLLSLDQNIQPGLKMVKPLFEVSPEELQSTQTNCT